MVTILMATRNRAAQLGRVLERYADLQSPPGGWKAVIVDNGSSDNTGGVVESHAARIPVQYMREDRPGKTIALNTGLAAVEGELVVLTDDDILVPPHWLVQFQAEASANPGFSIFAGPVIPRWPASPPQWIAGEPEVAFGVFAISTHTLTTGPVENAARDVLGGNFAVRASLFEQGYRFDANIGPSGNAYAMGSETEFVNRLVQAGHRAWWSADLVVEHVIRPEQLKLGWMWRRGVRSGRGLYRLHCYQHGQSWPFLFGVPRYAIRQVAEHAARVALATAARSPERRFKTMWNLAYHWGHLVEGRRMRNEGKTPQ